MVAADALSLSQDEDALVDQLKKLMLKHKDGEKSFQLLTEGVVVKRYALLRLVIAA